MKYSDPIQIFVENTSLIASTPVLLFNANAATQKQSNGSFIPNFGNNLKISFSGTSNVPYGVLLESIKSQPFNIGMINMKTSDADQLTKTMRITHARSDGFLEQEVLTPSLDPNQGLDTVTILKKEIKIDGYASIFFRLNPSASVTFWFYPSELINVANELIGESAIEKYKMRSLSQNSYLKGL